MEKITFSETKLRAKWMPSEDLDNYYQCSNCGIMIEFGPGEDEPDERCYPYCPFCGARMFEPMPEVDLFECLTPAQKKWGEFKGKTIAKIENWYYNKKTLWKDKRR